MSSPNGSNNRGWSASPTSDRIVLDEKSFRWAISLERKRTERSPRLFLLMLLDISTALNDDQHGKTLEKLLTGLTTWTRETDVVGWQSDGKVIGLIFTEIPMELRSSIVEIMLTRMRGELYKCLPFEIFNRIGISHHLFPEEWTHDVPQRPSHPSLYPDLSDREDRHKIFPIAKRAMDIVGASLGLLFCAPLISVIAAALKLSSKGPVFFRQTRVGQYGEPFTFFKFRSMYVNNDEAIHKQYVKALIGGSAERTTKDGANQPVFKLTSDPRVTPIGAFLRRTSLDELPQLYNVLKGEMSLVGPRPAIPYEVEAYELWHRRRVLEAKPGITGLWQVKGRSRVTFDEMVRLDVRYACSRSLWVDVKTLLQTPRAVFFGEGAH
jgi:lipopolysaccharide/colanic/teichoic acid biosynthesis glycosyltransferase